MKNALYQLLRLIVKSALYLYYKRIEVHGMVNIPKDKPIIFLPNHQNALLDVLLIVVNCNRKPYFLTRSDIFGKPLLNSFFEFLRMIPIYRIRDGRNSLAKNEAVFEQCAHILGRHEAIVVFPEANHNLERRVRPLSKGFTRIIKNALNENPKLDLQVIPVGLNYRMAEIFPDSAAVYYGKPIPVRALETEALIEEASSGLKKLTTHIETENYETIVGALNGLQPDYLNPKETNKLLETINLKKAVVPKTNIKKISFLSPIFWVLNFPMLLLWRYIIAKKVPEKEFTSTFRFMTCLLLYPLYYGLLCSVLSFVIGFEGAMLILLGIFTFNFGYVKKA
ncbi:lysophospholipid acyltransferase family protein [Maribacter sp. 2210JD10-5]|uniref:lysophospholipid acyltransferase family protein n=1 Tax=Maribacter sp. 2210JD10-5 TaxID=3386272 RepID=UPI0039BCE751